MAVQVNLTGENALHQGDDEVIQVTISPTSPTEDLTTVTSLRAVFKPDACSSDESPYAITLTSANVAEVEITTQTATEIVALIRIPGTYTAEPYARVWRVYAVSPSSPGGRTAIYGDVEVTDT